MKKKRVRHKKSSLDPLFNRPLPSQRAAIKNIQVPKHHSSPGEFINRNLDKIINEELYGKQYNIRPSRNKYFNQVIQELIDMHDKKNHDYSSDANPFSNFDFAAQYGEAVKGEGAYASDDSLIILKGVKLARLVNLITNRKGFTLNESMGDSEFDFVMYWILHRANGKRIADESLD